MLDNFILDDLDSFDIESDNSFSKEDLEDNFESSNESIEVSNWDYIPDEDSIIYDENIPRYDQFIESSHETDTTFSQEVKPHHHVSFGHALGWNGRCRVCDCRAWAGFGDTCANCGHFYNKHI